MIYGSRSQEERKQSQEMAQGNVSQLLRILYSHRRWLLRLTRIAGWVSSFSYPWVSFPFHSFFSSNCFGRTYLGMSSKLYDCLPDLSPWDPHVGLDAVQKLLSAISVPREKVSLMQGLALLREQVTRVREV